MSLNERHVFYCIISDTETFKQCHPVTNYDHYEKFVDRVAKGEQNVLISENPLILAMTSGTSGSSRMLLSTKDTNTDFFLQVITLTLSYMSKVSSYQWHHSPNNDKIQVS